jgi:hypothetical protein
MGAVWRTDEERAVGTSREARVSIDREEGPVYGLGAVWRGYSSDLRKATGGGREFGVECPFLELTVREGVRRTPGEEKKGWEACPG